MDLVNQEIERLNIFYEQKEEEFQLRLKELKKLGYQLAEHEPVNQEKARVLQAKIQQEYKEIDNLRTFASVNYLAIGKILKKYDKAAGTSEATQFFQTDMNCRFYTASRKLSDYLLQAETLYALLFEDGNTQKSALTLSRGQRTPESETYLFGFWTGMAVPMLAMIIIIGAVLPPLGVTDIPNFLQVFTVFRGVALVISACWLWGVLVWIWRRSRMNYVYILDFDPADTMTHMNVFRLSSLLTVIWVTCFMLYLGAAKDKLDFHIASYVYPLVMVCSMTFVLFCPFNIFQRSARGTLLNSLFHVMISPFGRVRFREFLLGDVLTSMYKPLIDIGYSICFFSSGEWLLLQPPVNSVCDSGWVHQVIPPVMSLLPYWWRFAQCIRRYYDTRQAFPHLANAAKYMSALLTIVFWSLQYEQAVARWTAMRVMWVIFLVISSVYQYIWDVMMDWGLARQLFSRNYTPTSHRWLREDRLYRHNWLYYVAIVTDLIARFFWAISISPTLQLLPDAYLTPLVAFIEIVRRTQWSIYRLEWETLSNFEQYRGTQFVPVMAMAQEHLYVSKIARPPPE
eukprot:TRINITY_DN9388_c0_g1_i1.p1 TRINITY_DN9388_c0_g1~~TRINITY_DN9388_c0_g1_i1.p1  ORF type:complete len:635 (-),score=124.84 TRINITY_DN9388_c0_g1_i1:794-2497(-)